MRVVDKKKDQLGHMVRLKSRVFARGNKQRPGIGFKNTFFSVTQMATFRMFIAIFVIRDINIYLGDIIIAYLNAIVGIKEFLKRVSGYPCEFTGMTYTIDKALYELHQSVRE